MQIHPLCDFRQSTLPPLWVCCALLFVMKGLDQVSSHVRLNLSAKKSSICSSQTLKGGEVQRGTQGEQVEWGAKVLLARVALYRAGGTTALTEVAVLAKALRQEGGADNPTAGRTAVTWPVPTTSVLVE